MDISFDSLPTNKSDKGSQTVAEDYEQYDKGSQTAAEDRDMIFLTKNVMIREGSRCCRKHLEDHRLTPAFVNKIED
ncbi:unnamed protein product [Didymodactylos carnosus]|uniref:Uncharacterized protein n=1 Tax=Didymodactylos carnosus TaxID=1234261 RepID=A0A816F9K0_9BILA|nr:unnamed protein product [Didymodactylos carnosus]CAF4600004.1 unnamed protein product [Didymodactylos carnosus]